MCQIVLRRYPYPIWLCFLIGINFGQDKHHSVLGFVAFYDWSRQVRLVVTNYTWSDTQFIWPDIISKIQMAKREWLPSDTRLRTFTEICSRSLTSSETYMCFRLLHILWALLTCPHPAILLYATLSKPLSPQQYHSQY